MSDEYFGFEEEEFHESMNSNTIVRIFHEVKNHWKWFAGFLIAILLVSLGEAIFTFMNKLLLDEGIIAGNRDRIIEIVTVNGGIILFQSAMVFTFIYLTGVLGDRVQYDLRQKLFNHLQKLSLSYYSKTPVGWIMSRVTSDTERIAELVTWGTLDMTWGIVNIVISSIFMLMINWQLALVVFITLPFLLATAIWFQKRIIKEYRIVRKTNSRITGIYNENITGVRVVKALRREEANLDEFSNLTDNYYRSAFKAAWLSALFLPVVQFLSAIALGIIVYYGGMQSQNGSISIGDIQAFISYVTFMLWPLQDLARVYASMQQAIASAERVFSLLDAEPDVFDKPNAVAQDTLRGDIVFDHVDFIYEGEKSVLKDFNLHVKAGETIALVGPTGAGKSTIVNLLCRFYEPTGGRILINGRDYTDMTLHSIQSRVGMVLQTPHLFSGSVRDNLVYGRLDATEEELIQAAKLAGAHDFIMKLEHGYDEEVGEGGNLLSTGQKQLISLARAVLADPEIFIMDEATSSVDTLTEALIQKGMETLMNGRTSFIIAHRLSTIRKADRILVIENGGISEMGTHAELIRQRGHYYSLYTQQFRREREKELSGEGVAQIEHVLQ